MDGDGENEVVATLAGPDGKPFCAILDGEGKLKRRLDLEPGTVTSTVARREVSGRGRGRWIILRMFYGEGAYQGRRPLVVAFDGKTGRKLWARDHYASYGPNPVIFAAHLPTAVHDLDGDGADDWLVCSENFYGVISVKDDREIVKPVVLSDAIPGHWTAYSYPSLGKVRAGGELHLLHNNAYSLALVTDLRGKPYWHLGLTRDTAGTWGILADVNGDGTSEFLHVQPDGLVRCFDVSAPRSRCATCPTEAQSSGVRSEGADPSRWSVDLKRPTSRMIAADLDGDGRLEIVMGCADGQSLRAGRALGAVPHPLESPSRSPGRRAGARRPRRRRPCRDPRQHRGRTAVLPAGSRRRGKGSGKNDRGSGCSRAPLERTNAARPRTSVHGTDGRSLQPRM